MRFNDKADRTNTVRRNDGNRVWVAPASLEKHGLKNGQTLTQEQWKSLGAKLAAEWVEYVEANS